MNQRNWLELDRKLVDKNDLEYTVDSMRQFVGASALSYFGFGVLPTTFFPNPFVIGMSNTVLGGSISNGIAYDPNGQFISLNSSSTDSKNFTVPTSDPALSRWDLLVLRYLQDGDTLVPKPSDPISSVYLNLVDGFAVVVIPGTASSSPSYPSKTPNDVILAGLQVPAAATMGSQITVDLSIRDTAKNNTVNNPVIVQENAVGLINGSNVIFNTSKSPGSANNILVILDNGPLSLDQWSYTAPNVITLNEAPAPGQSLVFWYIASEETSVNPLVGNQETPSGVIDGTNRTFTLAGKPASISSMLVFIDRTVVDNNNYDLVQSAGVYTLNFHAGFQPVVAQDLYCFYLINPSATGSGGGGSGGGVSTAENVGTGEGLFEALSGSVLQFKTLKAGTGVTLESDTDSVTINSTATGGVGVGVYGSLSSPESFDPTVGLTPGSEMIQYWFLKTSGGNQPVTAAKQIADGSSIGQILYLFGVDYTNFYTFQGAAGSVVDAISANGSCDLDANQCLGLFWDGSKWFEQSRRR